MAGISSPGVGSGLDIRSLVSQLVAAERKPVGDRIARDSKRIDSQITALGSLKGGLSSLQSALASLKSESDFQVRATTSSKPELFVASATSSAASGTYNVEVRNLATAHKLNSTPFLNGTSSIVGTGTLTISTGDQSFDVIVEAGTNTLGAIRDAINNSADNTGVSATIVQANDGARLVLAARNTGVENAISVAASGGEGGLNALVYDPNGTMNMQQLVPAADALVRIEGFDLSSATNTISNGIDGVTISLLKAEPDTTYTLTVANDPKAAKDRVKSFVTSFNQLATTMAGLRAYNPDTRVAGTLLGDALLRSVESEIRRTVSDRVSAAPEGLQSLSMIGITTNSDGTLKLDEAKLASALDSNFDAIGKLFGGEGGIGKQLDEVIDKYLDDDASLVKRAESLQKSKRELTTRTESLDARMEIIQQRYLKQFTALDTLLTQMQSTSSYLLQQLG
jgi:flagellar hook-associated protein 2